MAQQQLRRCIWLLEQIQGAGEYGITFEELNRKWMRSSLNDDEEPLKLRTFHMHKEALDNIFHIEIQCDRSTNRYSLVKTQDPFGRLRESMIDSMVLGSIVRDDESITNRIIFNSGVDETDHNFSTVIQAIKQGRVISFKYQASYTDDEGKEKSLSFKTTLEPYGLYDRPDTPRNVWYLVGRSPINGRVLLYQLNHLHGIELTEQVYSIPEDFDVEFFCNHYNYADEPIVELAKNRLYIPDDGPEFRPAKK